MKTNDIKLWKVYERVVVKFMSEEYSSEEWTVIPNARITGYISNRKRQIDVLIDYRFNHDLERRIIIDAKERKRPIDIKEVESFEGTMRDVGAQKGFLICTNGYTKAAQNRAQQAIGLKIIPESEIEELNISSWDYCCNCERGLVLWDLYFGIEYDGMNYIQATGKCDNCGKFHIWCWSCGNKYVIGSEEEFQCNNCEEPWFWMTSIEQEEDGSKYLYLLLILGNGLHYIIDKLPL
ncbi:MAG: restriction endonuclease [Macellibacteroides fermentans]|uniref:restriction endonuclease n=1 Tax=Macellibacteroides fermentans TaxID=879969 RepID=UPI003ACC7C69